MYSSDRVLNETILGIDEVHAEAGETNPLRKREFRERKIGSTELFKHSTYLTRPSFDELLKCRFEHLDLREGCIYCKL
jgi:hypothetical protein